MSNAKNTTMKTLAKAAPYRDISDLYVDTTTMQLYVTNYWSGKIQKYGSPDKINWNCYTVVEEDLARDFFGYEK